MTRLLPLSLLLLLACAGAADKAEGDGDVNLSDSGQGLDADGDGATAGEDCNDEDSSVGPAAPEICDGIDNNCDGDVDEGVIQDWYADEDSDGFGDPEVRESACAAPEGFVSVGTDCDDGDESAWPGNPELCDGVDNDCDGAIDDGVAATWYQDRDGDGYGDPDSAVEACAAPEGTVANNEDCDDESAAAWPENEEICDETDNDCDGDIDEGVTYTWYEDRDEDGYGITDSVQEACAQPAGYAPDSGDCDDDDPAYHPGAREADCADPSDYNCDGSTGYADADADGWAACLECDDSLASVNPDGSEVCNTIDDDCDGYLDDEDPDLDISTTTTWYEDDDGDGYGDPLDDVQSCAAPLGFTANSEDCDDGRRTINPDAVEVCNDLDDDCDALTDDADSDLDTTTASVYYDDDDGDGHGDASDLLRACDRPSGSALSAGDCDDTRADVSPTDPEVCNGINDDCDALTDEADAIDAPTWYVDDDGDDYGSSRLTMESCTEPAGFDDDDMDCDDSDATINPDAVDVWYSGVDYDCDGDELPDPCDGLPGAGTVAYDDECLDLPAVGSWGVEVEWASDDFTYSAGPTYTHIMAAPSVGQVTDDDGTGSVDEHDMPDIAYTTFAGSAYSAAGYLRVVSGDGTGEHWSATSATYGGTSYSVASSSGVAIGDIDADGTPELLVSSTGGYIMAFNHTGSIQWVSAGSCGSVYCSPSIHDIDADGTAEIISGSLVAEHTGATRFTMSYPALYNSFAADIDLDGTQEVLTGNVAYEPSGSVSWTNTSYSGRLAVANLDADSYGEVVQSYGSVMYAFDHNGSTLWTASRGDSGYGAACVADLDADGAVEIGAGGQSRFTVFETNGDLKWYNTVSDSSSSSASCTTFDFDGDGAYEIIYADQTDLYIWDGTTGGVLYQDTNHASGTLYEHPLVADVDADGEAELVVVSNNYTISGWDGLHVLGEVEGRWPNARMTFNQHGYHPSQVEEDGSIPTTSQPWGDLNGFRIQGPWAEEPLAGADLAPTVLGVCESCGVSTFNLYVAIENLGGLFAPAGVPVSVYAVNGTTRTRLATQETDEAIWPGERTAPMTFTLAESAVGATGLLVVVDDDGTSMDMIDECDETNNGGRWTEFECP